MTLLIYWCWLVAYIVVGLINWFIGRSHDIEGLAYLVKGDRELWTYHRNRAHEWSLILRYHILAFIGGAGLILWYEHWWLGL